MTRTLKWSRFASIAAVVVIFAAASSAVAGERVVAIGDIHGEYGKFVSLLRGADLSRAILDDADLTRGNFSSSNLTDASLIDAGLDKSNFSNAVVTVGTDMLTNPGPGELDGAIIKLTSALTPESDCPEIGLTARERRLKATASSPTNGTGQNGILPVPPTWPFSLQIRNAMRPSTADIERAVCQRPARLPVSIQRHSRSSTVSSI